MDFFDEKEALSYENVSSLVTNPDLLSHLQDLNLDGRENIVGFQWLGPHFLTFLKYAANLGDLSWSNNRFSDLLKLLDDSASDCILYGETEHFKNFLEIILSFMPQIREFFTMFDSDSDSTPNTINFLLETIEELLNFGTVSNLLVSNQVKVLLKELQFLINFLFDTMRGTEEEHKKNILDEIEAIFKEAGLFLHSFFFTIDFVTATTMDLAVFDLLERIEIVQVNIKYHFIAVSVKLNCEIGSLQVAESSTEVLSSLDKSSPMVEETIVGFEDMTNHVASKLLGGPSYCQIIAIVGMGGLGKTTLAKKIYNHSNVRYYFDMFSWCVISQTYRKRKLLLDILNSLTNLKTDNFTNTEDAELAERLYKTLKGRRYLIVMDDLWDKKAWDDFKRIFPDDRNGSRVLFTSRLKNVASKISHVIIEPSPLSPRESWNLLEQNVFKKERCPQELQDIGKKIAINCHGLPLSVVIIAGVLSNMEKKETLWQQVAESLSSYISQKANNYIPTLKLSYMHLPNHLKPCFLYLSVFEEDEEILVRKLLLLWIAEGLIEKKEHESLEDVAEEYLMDIIDRSLLQVSERRSDHGVKACTLHDLVRDMCSKIAVEDETLLFQHQFLISKHRHRLCMDQSYHLSKALSILYNSEKKRTWIPRCDVNVQLGVKIMPELRYLEIILLESSISKLQKLEFLDAYLIDDIPPYILNMPKLRHIRTRVNPVKFSKNCDSSRINSLQTLCYIYIHNSEDEEILRCSPNLRRLKCKSPDNHFPNLNFFTQLESLNMAYESRFIGDYSVVNFPKNIKKLTLSKIGLPWEKMSLIGTLPNLEILKLEYQAFAGEIWNTKDDEFQKLKFLKLHNLDFDQWNSSYDHFPILERLVLQSCENLEIIPSEFSNIPTLQKIEVHHCGKNVANSALEIREEQLDNGNEEFYVTISGTPRTT